MPYEKQLAFYEQALHAEKAINMQVAHETHRGRAMFTPWGTAQLLKDLPDLKITADFSHWCCAAPEYQRELETHELWWQQIVDLWDSKNASPNTLTPEFGPPGYMHTLPFTNQPVADLWDVCLWMARRLKEL
jgi:hypothetical protein